MTTRTVKFLKTDYVVEGTVDAPEGAIFLDTLPTAKLVELCNLLISNLDLGSRIKVFQNKGKGVKRVTDLLVKFDAEFTEAVEADEAEAETAPTGDCDEQATKKQEALIGCITSDDLIRHDFEEEDLVIVNSEWPNGIPATEASVARAFELGMDGGIFRKAIAAATHGAVAVAEFNDDLPKEMQPAPEAEAAPSIPQGKVRDGSKQAALVNLLKRSEGASIKEIVEALNWLPHTTRGAISRDVKKRLGYTVTTSKVEGRGRVYRIES